MEGLGPQGQQYPPGWYPDQHGVQRYWDGTRWTDQAPPPQAPPPEKKGGFSFGKGCLLVTLGVLLGGALLIGGCVALLGAGVEEAEKEATEKGITQAQFRSIEQGTSQAEAEKRLGPPEDSQEFEQEIPELQEQPSRSSCIYYPEKGKPLFEGQSFQLCFDEGKLTSKNAY